MGWCQMMSSLSTSRSTTTATIWLLYPQRHHLEVAVTSIDEVSDPGLFLLRYAAKIAVHQGGGTQ